MLKLGEIGVPTHFVRRLNMREQLIRQVEIIPIEVVVRNIAAGSLSRRFGLTDGTNLPRSIVEFYYKNDQLNDPIVSEEHITAFGWSTPAELEEIMALSLRINDYLSGLFLGIGLRLVDFKVEFGRVWENDDMRIILADEISPDNCRLWDVRTNERLDKDRFRQDLGKVEELHGTALSLDWTRDTGSGGRPQAGGVGRSRPGRIPRRDGRYPSCETGEDTYKARRSP
jgi:phosphoribosylaminoimidazole-succinocarboxamide synthase